ncbi:MAG: nucleoside triphosphate pyrophosphohydrolase [Gammaproteobacteria bacterium]|nr:nucleoside triphosphate pyrophosphohydrolase [Gammaproteobacteria bacterium]
MDAINQLVTVMTMLRDADHGCPWDLEQTIASLATYTLEEVYEVVAAIENANMPDLRDELGDLLFQVVFYAQIAREQGQFNFDDIAKAITQKLIRRHPHVFPDGDVSRFGQRQEISADEVVVNWEAIKQGERSAKRLQQGANDELEMASILDDVPLAMPALERARKLQKRAANVGFDWPTLQPVLTKLREEIAEFESAVQHEGQERMAQELGDILFAVVNLARHCNIEPEMALRGTNRRFEARFRWIERALHMQGKQPQEAKLMELDELWKAAKRSGL